MVRERAIELAAVRASPTRDIGISSASVPACDIGIIAGILDLIERSRSWYHWVFQTPDRKSEQFKLLTFALL